MLPQDVSVLYDWAPRLKISYGDFLRGRKLDGSIRYGIDTQNLDLIATHIQLAESGIAVEANQPERNFALLAQNIGQLEKGQKETHGEITGTPNWGNSEILLSQGQLNTPLEELIKLTKSSANQWPYQQFDKARIEFGQHNYKQALQLVTHAINGQGKDQGIKNEFRFHYLTGIIRLGSFRNPAPDVVNPHLAQLAFLSAARFVEAAFPQDAGQALICAGRAALVSGDIEGAITHTRKGLKLLPSHSGGTYQLGRALFLKGSSREATEILAEAMILNVENALHACGDSDILGKMDFLGGALRLAHEGYTVLYQKWGDRFLLAQQTLNDYSFMNVTMDKIPLKGLAQLQEVPKSAQALAETKTLFGYSAAINHLLNGFQMFSACFEEFKGHCIRILEKKATQPPCREDYVPKSFHDSKEGRSSRIGLVSGLVSGVSVFMFESSRMVGPIYRSILESMSELLVIPLGAAVGVAVAASFAEDFYREYQRSKYKAALNAYEAAHNSYVLLKNSLERQIGEIRSMKLPREFLPPILGNRAKPGKPENQPQGSKRVSAWDKLGSI